MIYLDLLVKLFVKQLNVKVSKKKIISSYLFNRIYLARAFTRRQTLRDEKARKMRELTHRVKKLQ